MIDATYALWIASFLPPTVAPAPPGGGAEWPKQAPPVAVRPPEIRYPLKSLRHNEEGQVRVHVLVGNDGVPRDCRILDSSGHTALDAGTCEMFLHARYAPPADEQGRPVESSFATTVQWLLPVRKRRPFGPTKMVIRLELDSDRVTNCTADGSGPMLADWLKVACTNFPRYYQTRILPLSPGRRHAEISLGMAPTDDRNSGKGQSGSSTVQAAEFVLGENRVTECRILPEHGFGPKLVEGAEPCFLLAPNAARFERPQKPGLTRRGLVTISISSPGE